MRIAATTAILLVVSGCLGAEGELREGASTAGDAGELVDGVREAAPEGEHVDGVRGAAPEGNGVGARAAADAQSDAQAAAEVLRRYYSAIDAGGYADAYHLWSSNGRASGQTLDEFAAGFADTRSVQLEVGAPGRVEGAAGSRYITIPVVVRAETKSGEAQHFDGSYVLRRSVVDGASQAQREWRISSAEVVERSGAVQLRDRTKNGSPTR